MRQAWSHFKDLQNKRIHALILCLLLCVASAFAKDVITKTDGTKLDVKVEEITETVIKYRNASNPTGPVYTIPVSSVSTVQYENGDIDTFNVSESTSDVAAQSTTLSDEELMRIAASQNNNHPSRYISDADMLKMYYGGYESSAALIQKANKYRKIGWIGGGIFLSIGVIIGIGVSDNFHECGYIASWAGMGLGAGALWCLGFNLKANSLMKQSRQMQSYSATLLEKEIVQLGNQSLTAEINLMGNRMVNSHSLGVSLGLYF